MFGIVASVIAVNDSGNQTSGCKNLYWFDDTTKVCTQKQFCGMYMYLGLQTFNSKTQCEEALNDSKTEKTKFTNSSKFLPWQKRNESECPTGCKCVGAVVSCETENGKIMTITAGNSGNVITIVVNKAEANTTSELETEAIGDNKTKLKVKSEDETLKEIKIMPDTASETAIARLGDLGFTIELKEVGKETTITSDDRVVYELTGNKQGKFLGIFKIMASERVQVDAETGEVKKVIKPWWSFLATNI